MYIHSPINKKETDSKLRRIDAPSSNKRYGKQNTGNRNKSFTKKQRKGRSKSWKNIKPWKVIVGTIVLGLMGILYLTHVFTTQQILRDVEQLERQHQKAKRIYMDRKLIYDRLTGPTFIYPKAKSMGFVNGGPADQIIEVERE